MYLIQGSVPRIKYIVHTAYYAQPPRPRFKYILNMRHCEQLFPAIQILHLLKQQMRIMSSINSLLFGIVLTTASINALSGGFNVNPTTATTNTTTPSWAGLIASGPSANASSVYAFPAAALASGPSNATTFVFSGANAVSLLKLFERH